MHARTLTGRPPHPPPPKHRSRDAARVSCCRWRQATNNDAWGPHGNDLKYLASASTSAEDRAAIFGILWKRVAEEKPELWRHIYKARRTALCVRSRRPGARAPFPVQACDRSRTVGRIGGPAGLLERPPGAQPSRRHRRRPRDAVAVRVRLPDRQRRHGVRPGAARQRVPPQGALQLPVQEPGGQGRRARTPRAAPAIAWRPHVPAYRLHEQGVELPLPSPPARLARRPGPERPAARPSLAGHQRASQEQPARAGAPVAPRTSSSVRSPQPPAHTL